MGQFKTLISSWFKFSDLGDSRNLTISFQFSNLMDYKFLNYSLIFPISVKYHYNFERDYIEHINL